MTDDYRSYIIRVRRHGTAPVAVQLIVEELLDGARVVLTGEAARRLAEELTTLVAGSRGEPEAATPP